MSNPHEENYQQFEQSLNLLSFRGQGCSNNQTMSSVRVIKLRNTKTFKFFPCRRRKTPAVSLSNKKFEKGRLDDRFIKEY